MSVSVRLLRLLSTASVEREISPIPSNESIRSETVARDIMKCLSISFWQTSPLKKMCMSTDPCAPESPSSAMLLSAERLATRAKALIVAMIGS